MPPLPLGDLPPDFLGATLDVAFFGGGLRAIMEAERRLCGSADSGCTNAEAHLRERAERQRGKSGDANRAHGRSTARGARALEAESSWAPQRRGGGGARKQSKEDGEELHGDSVSAGKVGVRDESAENCRGCGSRANKLPKGENR